MINVAFIGFLQKKEVVNGVNFAAHNLATGLNQIGVKVFFYEVSDSTTNFTDEGMVYRRFRKGLLPLKITDELSDFLEANPDQIDLFHFHSVFIPFFIPIQKILRKKGYPYVITPHGGYEKRILKKNSILKKLYIQLFEKHLLSNARSVICVSENEIADIRKISQNVPTKVISNPVLIPVEENIQPQQKKGAQVLVYLGRYDIYHKGLDKLIRIFKRVEDHDNNIQLHLYGQGKDKLKLAKLIESLELKNVELKEPVYGDKKVQVLKDATAYVQMSNWETFGISVVEAMLLSKPVIISEGCSLSKLFVESKAGLVVNNNDADKAADSIIKYISGTQNVLKDGEALKKLAKQKFSICQIVTETYNLYLQLLKRNHHYGSMINNVQSLESAALP
ncbi:glycosyltransferase family 4 protein [Cesiribacter sp. SM1]|uniref:glycosyltransferase family 4 protein n=1 Tax=Cesiribacter sp. SM1 TaxID=2861196 RepID=UPI001CD21F9A|nr:glycosyltransferase family 4 protein [Cesiribacter sp. SM1]